MEHYYCVIMSGGVGSRFWPISRQSRPKQFLDFFGTGSSLLQAVSYTHLVTTNRYMGLFKLRQELAVDLGTANTIIMKDGKIAVSYTHLDVYKRQGRGRHRAY